MSAIRAVHVPVYPAEGGDRVIEMQDVTVPGRVVGIAAGWHLSEGERLCIKLWCLESQAHTIGVYMARTDEELPLNLDLAMTYGPQARWLGYVSGTHVFIGPAEGQPIGL